MKYLLACKLKNLSRKTQRTQGNRPWLVIPNDLRKISPFGRNDQGGGV
jgi:hypothetical protein